MKNNQIKKKKNIAGRMLVSSILVGGLALGGFYAADYLRKKDNLIAEQAATIVEQNSTIDDLTLQNTNLGGQITTLQTQKSALEGERDETLNYITELETAFQNLLETKDILVVTVRYHEEQEVIYLEDIDNLNTSLSQVNEEIVELQSELADELLANTQNQETIANLQSDLTALNNIKSGLELSLSEKQLELDELMLDIADLNTQIETCNLAISEKSAEISTLNQSVSSLNGQIADLNTNITTLQSKVSSAENVINFITLPEYTDPIFFEHQLDITSLNGYLNSYVSDVYYSLLINSVEVPFTGTSLKLTSYLTDEINLIELRTYVSYNNTIYYGQTFSTSIDYIAPVYVQMSIAEALSAENGTLIEVTGIVTGKYSSLTVGNRYNTLYVADSTGEIVVYEGATNWLDVQIGDIITAKGDKTIYQNLNEIQHATIENSEEEITAIERVEATTYADLISKIPQRISFTAPVQSFLNDYEVVVSFDNTNLNIRLEDSRVLTSIFEVGKTYQINAHMHSKSSTKTFLVIQSLDDIVEKVRVEVADTQFGSLNLYNAILALTGEEKIYQDSLINFSNIDLSNNEISSINGLQLLDYQVGTIIDLTNNKLSSLSSRFQTLISKENISMVNLMFNNIIPGSPGAEVGNKYVLGIQGLIKDAYFYEDSSNIKFYNYNDFYNIFTLDCNISSVNEGENTITDFGSYQISFLNEFNTITKTFKYGSVNLYLTQSSIDAFEGQNFNISNYIIFEPEEFTEEDFVIKYFLGMQEFTEEDLNTAISSSLGTRNLTIQVYYNNSLITQAFASINTL